VKVRLTINGKKVEMTLDEVKAAAQREIAGAGKLEQAKKEIAEARTIKETVIQQQTAMRGLLQVIANGDFDALSEFVDTELKAGDKFKQGLVNHAVALVKFHQMSPEQKEAIVAKRELERMRKAKAQRDETDKSRAHDYQVNQWTQHLTIEIPRAINEAGLPDSQFVRNQIISTWRMAIDRGQQPTALAVAQYVKSQLDEARMLHAPQQPPQPVKPRPRATRESVGMKSQGATAQYTSFEDRKRSRGR